MFAYNLQSSWFDNQINVDHHAIENLVNSNLFSTPIFRFQFITDSPKSVFVQMWWSFSKYHDFNQFSIYNCISLAVEKRQFESSHTEWIGKQTMWKKQGAEKSK